MATRSARSTKGPKGKRRGTELDMRSFTGKRNRKSYLVFRTSSGSYHAFMEVEAKDAARACGAKVDGNTRQMWSQVWDGEH